MEYIKYKEIEVYNRESPDNEEEYRKAYEIVNPRADRKNDGLDISAVVTISGEKGHALLAEEDNRSKDENTLFSAKDFVPDDILERLM